MLRAILLLAFLFATNFKLYLKDGGSHMVREYKVLEDRVRYYSVERSDWEEIPIELVDLKRTQEELKEREEEQKADAKSVEEERAFERQIRKELRSIPEDPGVYKVEGDKVITLKLAECKVVTNKKRSVLKALSPIPLVPGKATVEIDGLKSAIVFTDERPEFYFRLNKEERFGIVRLTPLKTSRLLEKWNILPVVNEIVQEHDDVEIFRKQVGDGLYKIWPVRPIGVGEYAVMEYNENKGNTQAWDFSRR
jgi:hypothetical protein